MDNKKHMIDFKTMKLNPKDYKEVYSEDESIELLNKYAKYITEEQYKKNKSIICNNSIEGIYLNEYDILNLVRMDNGVSGNTIRQELKESL